MAEFGLTLALYGAFDVRIRNTPANLGLTGPTRSLLQFLVCNGGRLIRREHLMETFWSGTDPRRRRSSLNSAIWRIKKTFREKGAPTSFRLDASADCVRLEGTDAADIDIDIVCLARSLASASTTDAADSQLETLLSALDRCEGLPLDGVEADWALFERERLSALRMKALSVAMRHLKLRRRYGEAIEFGQRILFDDPFHETALQELLCVHALSGQRVRALRLFEDFSRSLRDELNIAPMPETRALRDYLAGDDGVVRRLPRRQTPTQYRVLETPGVADLVGMIEFARASNGAMH